MKDVDSRGKVLKIAYVMCILLSFYFQGTLAQLPFFKIRQVDKEHPEIRINKIIQDSNKILWIGTSRGLYSYDGYEFNKTYEDSLFLRKSITSIFEDSKHHLWIGAEDGKVGILVENKIIPGLKKEQMPSVKITSIIEDNNGTIWIGTYGKGIFLLNNKKLENLASENGLADDFIYCLLLDKKNRIWAGTDGGVCIVERKDLKNSVKCLNTKDGLSDNIITSIISDKEGNLFLGTDEKGIIKYLIKENRVEVPDVISNWNYGAIHTMIIMENELWLGTTGNGIVDYEFKGDKRLRLFNSSNGFNYLTINSLCKDSEGNVWVASGNNLLQAPGEKIEFLDERNFFPFKNIRSITNDRNNNIWFSTDEGLFFYPLTQTNKIEVKKILKGTVPEKFRVTSLYADNFGYLWIGTFDNGIIRLNIATDSIYRVLPNTDLFKSNVLFITGSKNEIWAAVIGGAFHISITSDEKGESASFEYNYFDRSKGLGSNYIYHIYSDTRNRAWFATDGDGITVFDNGSFANYKDILGLKVKTFYSIAEDLKGDIWFASANEGLYHFNGSTFKNFSLSSGLRDLAVSSLIKDGKGNIIVVHRQGIDKINPVNLSVTYYDREMGVENIDPDLNAVCCDLKGNVWAGTQKGIIKINNLADPEQTKPYLILTKVTNLFEQVDFTNVKEFKYNQNYLSFSYTGIWYTNPEKVTYRYTLEGFSKEWIETKDRVATFPNLLPGKYTFKIQASADNIYDNNQLLKFTFTIRPPFWQTSWFYLLVSILIFAGLSFFIKLRDKRLKKLEAAKKEKIEFEFNTLKNQVNPHFLFNSFNTLISIIEQDKALAVEYVEKLSDFFRNIVNYREKEVISLEEELKLAEAYIFLQKKRYGEHLHVSVQISAVQKKECNIPPLTLQLLLENAIKHNAVSKETPLYVELFFDDAGKLVVKNNLNQKIKQEPSTGIGLSNVQSRYRLLTGEQVEIFHDDRIFTIKLPSLKNNP